MLIVSLFLASSFYFIPLPDRESRKPVEVEQAQEPLPSPATDHTLPPASTPGPTSLAGRASVVPPTFEETTGLNKPSSPAEDSPPKQASSTYPRPGGGAAPAGPAPATAEHLSNRDFSIPPSSLQNRILPAIQDNHF
ncbi:MAG: hypothetical protein U1F76_13655 [Candidatus Competibacteraceae bacterium]